MCMLFLLGLQTLFFKTSKCKLKYEGYQISVFDEREGDIFGVKLILITNCTNVIYETNC